MSRLLNTEHQHHLEVAVFVLLSALCCSSNGQAQNPATAEPSGRLRVASIPKLTKGPTISDFEGMNPRGAAKDMVVVSNFIQSDPSDGQPATQKTDVYLGYDNNSLYVVWLCFDSEPGRIRAHLVRRENIYDDDFVEITLDT